MRKKNLILTTSCRWCSEIITYRKSGDYTPKFCCKVCHCNWRSEFFKGNKHREGHKPVNAFPEGHKPWNRDLKGIHLSPETEFKKGRKSTRELPVGSITVRHYKKHPNNPRTFVKISEHKWILRATLLWEEHNGKLPKGYVIHHKDRNTLNDDISNLEAVTRSEHLKEHLPEYEERMRKAAGEASKRRWKKYRQEKADKG